MQLPEEVRKCIVFVGYSKDGKDILRGTAFVLQYVGDDEGTANAGCLYLVTAKHNLWKAKQCGAEKLLVRFNTKNGKSCSIETPFLDWTPNIDLPQDEQDIPANLDIAVLPLFGESGSWLQGDIDVVPYKSKNHINPESIRFLPITVGDEIFFPGLFHAHLDAERNVPVIRCGNIAAMADENEKVRANICGTNCQIEAYLIEARSLGGLSGSPVFVYTPSRRREYTNDDGKQVVKEIRKVTTYSLLGVVNGHYDRDRINEGMAIVVPFPQVLKNVLEIPKLRDQRLRQGFSQ